MSLHRSNFLFLSSETNASIISLREKGPNLKFFLVPIFLYSVRIQENTDQKKLRICTLFMQCLCYYLYCICVFLFSDFLVFKNLSKRLLHSSRPISWVIKRSVIKFSSEIAIIFQSWVNLKFVCLKNACIGKLGEN